jgi:predicted nucleic acid binding AN1-type Zn finger protein
MENDLAKVRIYLMVVVFFSSCFMGLMSGVSIPMLAMRSVIIVCIAGILSKLLIKYIVSVSNTASPKKSDQMNDSIPQDVNHGKD